MNLHRAGQRPQWESVPPEDRNVFQRVANATKGIVTPGNVVSAIGVGLVASGLKDIKQDKTFTGTMKLGVGRVFDLLDGVAADKTGTKSPLGEAVDVVIDKAELVAASEILRDKDIIPSQLASMLISQHGATTLHAAVAKQRGNEIHPTQAGKLATFALWSNVGLYCLARAAEEHDLSIAETVKGTADAMTPLTIAMGALTVQGYEKDAFRGSPAAQE